MVPLTGNPGPGKLDEQKADQLLPGSLGERKALIGKGHRAFWRVMEVFSVIISLVLI